MRESLRADTRIEPEQEQAQRWTYMHAIAMEFLSVYIHEKIMARSKPGVKRFLHL